MSKNNSSHYYELISSLLLDGNLTALQQQKILTEISNNMANNNEREKIKSVLSRLAGGQDILNFMAKWPAFFTAPETKFFAILMLKVLLQRHPIRLKVLAYILDRLDEKDDILNKIVTLDKYIAKSIIDMIRIQESNLSSSRELLRELLIFLSPDTLLYFINNLVEWQWQPWLVNSIVYYVPEKIIDLINKTPALLNELLSQHYSMHELLDSYFPEKIQDLLRKDIMLKRQLNRYVKKDTFTTSTASFFVSDKRKYDENVTSPFIKKPR